MSSQNGVKAIRLLHGAQLVIPAWPLASFQQPCQDGATPLLARCGHALLRRTNESAILAPGSASMKKLVTAAASDAWPADFTAHLLARSAGKPMHARLREVGERDRRL